METQFGNKLSNVIGVPVPQWLVNQFNVRSENNSQIYRSTDNVKYLANRTAWVRLVSSVNIGYGDMEYFKRLIGDSVEITDPSSLAKNFVLFAGTSKYQKDNNGDFSYELRSGLEGAYGILGKEEISRYGYQPMPGITNVTVETMGRMGSVRSATINFKVHNKLQLDVADALYFKLGYTMFLEWANTYYYETPNKVESVNANELRVSSTEYLSIDPFEEGLTKEKINYKISKNVKDSYGNYDGMLGVVTNFNFSRKEDGSYDCTLKLIGLGALAESIKVNKSDFFTPILEQEIKPLVENENSRIQAELDIKAASLQDQIKQKQEEQKKAKDELDKRKDFYQIVREDFGLRPEVNLENYEYVPGNKKRSDRDLDYVNDNTWAIGKFYTLYKTGNTVNTINLDSEKIQKVISDIGVNSIIRNKKLQSFSFFGERLTTYDISYTKNAFSLNPANVDTTNIRVSDFTTISTTETRKYKFEISFYFNTLSIALEKASQPPLSEEVIQNIERAILSSNFFSNVRIENENLRLNVKEDDDYYSTRNSQYPELIITLNWSNVYSYLTDTISQLKPLKKIGDFEFPVVITITDSDLIRDLKINDNPGEQSRELFENAQRENAEAIAREITNLQQSVDRIQSGEELIKIKEAQKQEAAKYSSSIETILRTIQIRALNVGTEISKKVVEVDLSKPTANSDTKLSEKILKEFGLYSSIYDDLFVSKNIPDYNINALDTIGPKELFKFYAKYGFNSSLLSGNTTNSDLSKMYFDHADLLKAYVIPHEVSQDFSSGIVLNRPVHIKFGTLLMLLNHVSLIYDVKGEGKSKESTPLVYIDYNPNTNFCLTEPNHFSTNPIDFLIPYGGTAKDFEKLFDPDILNKLKEDGGIFDPEVDDAISANIPQFLEENPSNESAFRGKIMNILVDVQYLLNTTKRFASVDGTNSVYLKSFLEAILSDMSKYTGNYNIFRLAYNDAGNCMYIVDDQLTPPKEADVLNRSTEVNRTEIPLYGNKSIAKSLEVRTDVSSRLANMIAISANSPEKQGVLSTDSTSFGFINSNFRDRYVEYRGSPENGSQNNASAQNNNEGDINAAKAFNEAVKRFYGYINVSSDSVSTATNYYISKISKVKSQNPATRASAMIPVSVNFTTDGISGFNMYQSFTISDELLPYTYTIDNTIRTKAFDERIFIQNLKSSIESSVEKRGLKNVGFCVVGLTHTIDANQWNTSVKSNMIFLKDSTDYKRQYVKINRSASEVTEEELGEDFIDVKTDVGDIRPTKKYTDFISLPRVKEKVEDIARYIGVQANDLYVVFYSESGFDSTIQNKYTRATGLIQFMPRTAEGLGTTVDQLKNMPVLEQLDYVRKYYTPFRGRVKDVYDLYLCTFWPVALTKPDSYVFQTKKVTAQKVSDQNPAIARLSGKKRGEPLTITDFKKYVQQKIRGFTQDA